MLVAGEALDGPEAATTLRTRGGAVQITDGPYAEAVEGMGGFYLIEAPDLDVLLELADRILVLCGGKVSGIVPGRGATKRDVGMMMTQLGGNEAHA